MAAAPQDPTPTRQVLVRAVDLNCVIRLDRDSRDAYLCVPLEPPVNVTRQIKELEGDGLAELRHSGTPQVADEWVLTAAGRAELAALKGAETTDR
ncbi:MAG TPA: hypothetical protein VI011_18725 [Asanoa sp.]